MDHGLSGVNMQADLGNTVIRSRDKIKRSSKDLTAEAQRTQGKDKVGFKT